MGASVEDGMLELDAGLEFQINSEDHRATVAELLDQGLTLLTVTPTNAHLSADLPVALQVGGTTAADTTLKFETDDLFGDIENLISQLPSLDDIANLSIDEIIGGIRKGLDLIEEYAFQPGVNEVQTCGIFGTV